MIAAYRRPLFAAALALFLFQAPAAMAYEGLTSSGGEAPSSDGGGYDGLVGWPATQGASNPYGAAPAEDIYGLVKGTGATPEQRAENARRAREEQKLQRQQEMRERNLKRAQEMQSKLEAQSDAQQRRIMEHQNDIMRRMQQQQRQQQQR